MQEKSLNNNLIEAIFSLSRLMKQEMSVKSGFTQLTVLQLEILMFLFQNKKTKGVDIANRFHTAKSTTSTHLDRLQQMKLVSKKADPQDRRIDWIVLTNKGKTLLNRGMKQKNLRMNQILKLIAVVDREKLLNIIIHLNNSLEKQYERRKK